MIVKTSIKAAVLTVLLLGVYSTAYATPIVANGDFETDGVGVPTGFNTFPGYVGQIGNPAQVTDFVGPGGGYGVNNPTTGLNPFSDNGNDPTNVLFIQSGGTTLTQTISGFAPGGTYQLAFDYNARNCCGGTAGITVSLGVGAFADPLDTPVGGANPYHHASFQFVAGPSGTETLSINKFDAVGGDSSALFDNFVITTVSIPEPSSCVLVALGLCGLLGWAGRRRVVG